MKKFARKLASSFDNDISVKDRPISFRIIVTLLILLALGTVLYCVFKFMA